MVEFPGGGAKFPQTQRNCSVISLQKFLKIKTSTQQNHSKVFKSSSLVTWHGAPWPVSSKAMHLPTGYLCGWLAGWLCGVSHVQQMQPWQQPRSQNIAAPAEARIVKEAGILALRALQNRQNGEGLQQVCAFLIWEDEIFTLVFVGAEVIAQEGRLIYD